MARPAAIVTKRYELPEGVRFLTDDERAARKAAKLERVTVGQAKAAADEIGRGFAIPRLPKLRRSRRRRAFRPPAGMFRFPGR